MIQITSLKNPLIKEVKSLYKKKGRISSKSFIIEGIKTIEEAINNGYDLRKIIYCDRLLKSRDGLDFFKIIEYMDNLVYVSNNIFKEISDTENPQGILAIAKLEFRNLSELDNKEKPFLLFLDGLQDPGNMGTIIRTADAFNIDGIILTDGCVDPYNPKVVRATMGSIFRLPLYYISNGVDELASLKNRGMKIYSTSLEGSLPIYDLDYKSGTILVIGNESKGVSDEIFALSHGLIRIPMPGKAESLNAGVAASIIMYEAIKQRINIS